MNKNIQDIIDYSEGKLSKSRLRKFEADLLIDKELQEDFNIYRQVNAFLRARHDLDEVMNDKGLIEADAAAKKSIEDYKSDPGYNKERIEFIEGALHGRSSKKRIWEEIDEIESELGDNDINSVTESWVNEWIAKQETRNIPDPATEKLIDYISDALESEEETPVLKLVHKNSKAAGRRILMRITGLAAAVLIAGFLVFKTLIPSSDPNAIYNEYYNLFSANSAGVRGENTAVNDYYNPAIEYYQKGDYANAASLLNLAIQKDPDFVSPHFFQGITQMELGNYGEAVSQLSIVASRNREFKKEAMWYLGLSYLKLNESVKAIPYFTALSETEGYYQDQSGKILRRLK